MRAQDYNKKTMEKFGWGPEHLGLSPSASMDDVVAAVVTFQLQNGLEADGKVGPMTWGRIQAAYEFKKVEEYPEAEGFVLVNGSVVPVGFKSVVCSPDSAYSLIGCGGHSTRTEDPTQLVWHWDAALSGDSCYKILRKRQLTYHGVIDNDGTFIQFLDLSKHVAWHAGHRGVNRRSIGVSLSNAVYTKYQSYYERRWGPRPVIEATVHNRDHTLLGYYPAQIDTATKLASFINDCFSIPLVSPETTTVIEDPENYCGHLAHYHITKNKWDVAGFPFNLVLEDSRNA